MSGKRADTRRAAPPPGYAMVPAWLLYSGADANEILVYAHLAMFGTFSTGFQVYEECRPSKQTLADGGELRRRHCTGGDDCDGKCGAYHGTGLSVSTVYRAIKGLLAKNAIEGEERYDPRDGSQLPTVYRLIHMNPDMVTVPRVNPHAVDRPEDPPVTHDRGGAVTHDRDPLSPMTDNPEPSTQRKPPPPTPPADSTGRGPSRSGREEEASEIIANALRALGPKTPIRGTRLADLTRRAADRLRAGWPPDAVDAVLRESLDGARSVYAVLVRRLDGLDGQPPPPPAGPSQRWTTRWCGTCDSERTRRAYANPDDGTDHTLAGPCPTCGQDSMRLTSVA